jgi:hypothetical protein
MTRKQSAAALKNRTDAYLEAVHQALRNAYADGGTHISGLLRSPVHEVRIDAEIWLFSQLLDHRDPDVRRVGEENILRLRRTLEDSCEGSPLKDSRPLQSTAIIRPSSESRKNVTQRDRRSGKT